MNDYCDQAKFDEERADRSPRDRQVNSSRSARL